MPFNPDPFEQTTAATDAVLMLVAVGCALGLGRTRKQLDSETLRFKSTLWIWANLSLAAASLCGTLVHGITISEAVSRALWVPLNGALGVTVALFVAGAIFDARGEAASRRALPVLLGIAAAFVITGTVFRQSFLLFLPLQGLGLLYALWTYARRAMAHAPGSRPIVAGIALSIGASLAQASRAIEFTLVWPFDHRGAFHLIQMVALPLICRGVQRSLWEESKKSPFQKNSD